MGVWGKIIGGVAGFALGGGPFGAILGAALGHQADKGVGGRTAPGLGQAEPGAAALRMAAMLGRRDEVFALCVVVLSAKLAKADGPVNRAEIAAFRQHFRVPPQSTREVGRLFDTARSTPEGFEPYAAQLGQTFVDAPGVLEDVLAALFSIARADRPVTAPEARVLQAICHQFGLGQSAWDRASGARPRTAGGGASMDDAYGALGLTRDATDEALRERWRALMRENHPDSLASRGVAAEFIARAGDRVARINAAWDTIKRERGL